MKKFLIVLILFQNLSNLYAKEESIQLVTIDEKGQEKLIDVEQKNFSNQLKGISTVLEDSTIDAFNKVESKGHLGWHMRTFILALAAQAELGAGPLKMSVLPRVKFYFTNNTNPSTP